MKALRVFYTPKQAAPDNVSFSPSAGKPPQVVESWQRLGIPLDIIEPQALSRDDLKLAHEPHYVDGVLDREIPNGFGNTLASVAASLQYTSGSLFSAARDALSSGNVALTPTSGFHHAGYHAGGGFCTFNGLIIAAQILLRDHSVGRVGILDLDQHYGNGTDEIIQRLGLDFLEHYTLGKTDVNPRNAAAWLDGLSDLVRERFSGCGVLLYQAGVDPHIDDPLGGRLTTEQLTRRDRIVFTATREMKLPVAWNLAGGYQQPIERVLALHDNTARMCAEVYLAFTAP